MMIRRSKSIIFPLGADNIYVLQLLLRAGNVLQASYLILYPLWCLKHKVPFSFQVITQI